MWDTATAELKHTLLADRCVVNCVAPHPHLPLFASSGIDNEVRLPGLTLPPLSPRPHPSPHP